MNLIQERLSMQLAANAKRRGLEEVLETLNRRKIEFRKAKPSLRQDNTVAFAKSLSMEKGIEKERNTVTILGATEKESSTDTIRLERAKKVSTIIVV